MKQARPVPPFPHADKSHFIRHRIQFLVTKSALDGANGSGRCSRFLFPAGHCEPQSDGMGEAESLVANALAGLGLFVSLVSPVYRIWPRFRCHSSARLLSTAELSGRIRPTLRFSGSNGRGRWRLEALTWPVDSAMPTVPVAHRGLSCPPLPICIRFALVSDYLWVRTPLATMRTKVRLAIHAGLGIIANSKPTHGAFLHRLSHARSGRPFTGLTSTRHKPRSS